MKSRITKFIAHAALDFAGCVIALVTLTLYVAIAGALVGLFLVVVLEVSR